MFVETIKAAGEAITDDEREAARQSKRREIRRQIAQAELSERNYLETRREAERLDARIDAAEAKHQASCLPAQARINEIEKRVVERIADRLPVPQELESERAALMSQIADENETLQREVNTVKELLVPIHKRLNDPEGVGRVTVLRNKLASDELCRPDIITERALLRVIFNALQAESQRLENGIQQERQLSESENQKHNRHVYVARIAKYESILTRVVAEREKYREDIARLHQEAVNE